MRFLAIAAETQTRQYFVKNTVILNRHRPCGCRDHCHVLQNYGLFDLDLDHPWFTVLISLGFRCGSDDTLESAESWHTYISGITLRYELLDCGQLVDSNRNLIDSEMQTCGVRLNLRRMSTNPEITTKQKMPETTLCGCTTWHATF